MAKFNYILGWLACVGSVGALIAAVVALILEGWPGSIALKFIWMPFVFLWGLSKIRNYRIYKTLQAQYEKKGVIHG